MDAADDGCCRGLRPVDICARKRSKRSVTGGSGEGPTISPPVSPVGGAHETTLLKLPFQLGDTVEANWRLRGAYYMGVVTATNQDGTYSIKYVDGDSEERVLGGNIRKLQTRRRAVVAASERASRQTKQRSCRPETSSSPRSKRPKHNICTASSAAPTDASAAHTIPLDLQLQVWQGSGPILSTEALGHRRSSLEFHDVFGSTLSPARQNETVGRCSVAQREGIEVPRVLSDTPHYYRKQNRFETQEDYLKYSKSAVEVEAEVDYELDQDDDQWLAALNEGLRDQGVTASKDPLPARHMEVLIDRFEKADAKMHKMLGHSAARVEVLMTDRSGFTDVPHVCNDIQEQVHQWWRQKRKQTGQQLLRRFRAPPDPDDPDVGKAFRRVSPFRSQVMMSELSNLKADIHDTTHVQVGDIVEANWCGRGNYYSGLVAAVNPNGTYAIKYDDGDCEDNMSADSIRNLGRRRGVARTSSVTNNNDKSIQGKQQSPRERTDTDVYSNCHGAYTTRNQRTSISRMGARDTRKSTRSSASRKRACPAEAIDSLMTVEEALLLEVGARILYKWQEPGGKDDGVWYAATVGKRLSSAGRNGWYELEFDQFTVSNAHSWNLPHHANRGGLRRAKSVAANRLRRGGGASTLEWSKDLGGGVDNADEAHGKSVDLNIPDVKRQPVPASASEGAAERKLIGKWRKSNVKPREQVAENKAATTATDPSDDETWRCLWAALMRVGWRSERFLGGEILYFPPREETGDRTGGRTFFDTKSGVLSYLATLSGTS